jgi:nitrogen fixation protein FixH
MKFTILIVSVLALSAVVGAIVVGNMSFEGIVVDDPYETGLIWDEIQNDRESSGIVIRLQSSHFNKGKNRIRLLLEKSKPVDIDSIVLKISRPTTVALDRQVAISSLSGNEYQADVDLPLIGNWDLIVQVTINGKRILFSNRIYAQE